LLFLLILIISLTGCSNLYQIEVTDEQAENALNIALEQINKPYEWGGRGSDKFDCSGLITWSYKQALGEDDIFRVGTYVTNDAAMDDLYRWNVALLQIKEIKPGDIIFITSEEDAITHGGLFIRWIDEDTFEFINASSYEEYRKVVIDTWPVEGEKREQWFAGAARLKTIYNY
jgi:hypothetical protein